MANQESLTKKTFKGFFWSFGGKIVTAILQIGVLAILARLISPESFGIVQSALVVVGLANIINQIGIGPALVQIQNITDRHIRVGFTFSMTLGFLLALVVYLSSSIIAAFFKIMELTSVLKVISILFIFESFTTVSASLMQRDMRLKIKALIEIISYFFGYGLCGIIFGYLGYDYWALIIAIIGQAIFKLVAYAFYQRHSFSILWSKPEFGELFKFGGGYTLAKLSSYFALQGDNIIAGKYLGASALGVYSRAYTIMTKPVGMVGDAFNKAFFPAMAARQSEPDKLIRVFLNGSKMMLFTSIIFSFVIVSSSKEIVHILLGDGWEEAIIPLQILALGLFFRLGYKLGAELSKAMGKVNKLALFLFIYAIATFVGCYIGVRWGVIGVAFGTLFAITINYILMNYLALSLLKVKWGVFIKSIYPEFLLSCLTGIIFIGVITSVRYFFNSSIVVLMVSGLIYTGILMVSFYFYGRHISFIEILPYKEKLKKYMR